MSSRSQAYQEGDDKMVKVKSHVRSKKHGMWGKTVVREHTRRAPKNKHDDMLYPRECDNCGVLISTDDYHKYSGLCASCEKYRKEGGDIHRNLDYDDIDTSTEKGIRAAEQRKAEYENKYDRVTVRLIGPDMVRITGEND